MAIPISAPSPWAGLAAAPHSGEGVGRALAAIEARREAERARAEEERVKQIIAESGRGLPRTGEGYLEQGARLFAAGLPDQGLDLTRIGLGLSQVERARAEMQQRQASAAAAAAAPPEPHIRQAGRHVTAFDKLTGEVLWRGEHDSDEARRGPLVTPAEVADATLNPALAIDWDDDKRRAALDLCAGDPGCRRRLALPTDEGADWAGRLLKAYDEDEIEGFSTFKDDIRRTWLDGRAEKLRGCPEQMAIDNHLGVPHDPRCIGDPTAGQPAPAGAAAYEEEMHRPPARAAGGAPAPAPLTSPAIAAAEDPCAGLPPAQEFACRAAQDNPEPAELAPGQPITDGGGGFGGWLSNLFRPRGGGF